MEDKHSQDANEKKLERIRSTIGTYPDFPKPGIIFKDIFPLFRNPDVVDDLISLMEQHIRTKHPEANTIVGLESRGFLLGPLLAHRLRMAFVPIRKAGKLPGPVTSVRYSLEYGEDSVEIQTESVGSTSRCVIVDDLLATGGSVQAAVQLIGKCPGGARVDGVVVIIELIDLNGREKYGNIETYSLVKY